jgi:hypothetical protein
MVAAFVFSTLLLSNLAIFAASEKLEQLSSQSDAESLLYAGTHISVGTQSLLLLERVQESISGQVLGCSTATETVASFVGGLSFSRRADNFMVVGRLNIEPSGNRFDNLSMLQPFNGSSTGNLAMALTVALHGTVPGSGVVLAKTESHTLSLPVRLSDVVSFCQDALHFVTESLTRPPQQSCNSGTLRDSISSVNDALAQRAAGSGLRFSLLTSLEEGITCRLDFECQVSQNIVFGPEGPFTVRAEEQGFVAFPTST